MMRKAFRKIRSSSGESLTETLTALLLMVLAFTMLAGAVVSAAKVNRAAKDISVYCSRNGSHPVEGRILLDGKEVEGVTLYEENGFYYFE